MIQRINDNLAEYYRIQNTDYFDGDDSKGKFIEWCDENGSMMNILRKKWNRMIVFLLNPMKMSQG